MVGVFRAGEAGLSLPPRAAGREKPPRSGLLVLSTLAISLSCASMLLSCPSGVLARRRSAGQHRSGEVTCMGRLAGAVAQARVPGLS